MQEIRNICLKGEKMMAITKTWKVYGRDGHRQRESFCDSYKHDFSNEKVGIRLLTVLNSDVTGTNEYSIVSITRNSAEECIKELEGQLSDGIFENSNTGEVEEIDNSELEKFKIVDA